MDPQLYEVIWFFDSILFGSKKTLEHIGQVTDVEFVMEVLGCLSELKLDIAEKLKRALHDRVDELRNGDLEALEVLLKVSEVNCRQRRLLGHAD